MKYLEVFVEKYRILYSIADSIYRVEEQLVLFSLSNESYIILIAQGLEFFSYIVRTL